MLGATVAIESVDVVIIVAYLAAIVGIGCWVGFRRRRGVEGKEYFLAGRTLTWPVIGLALFSVNISTIHLVSQAQEGYLNGLAYGNFEWMAPFTLIALSLFFAPFYLRSKVATLPDFLEQRYSRSCRDWLALLSIISAVFIHIGFTLYTGAVVLEGLFGIPVMTSIVIAAVLTGAYTIIGGLLAVVVTESAQTIILLVGAITVTVVGYYKVGGWAGLADNVEAVKLTILRSADDPANLPWYSVFLGYPIIGIWYWCADQTIVQRVLGAKDANHARVGPLFAGFIKILPVFIFVMPGTICLALINQGKLPSLQDSKDVYAFMITHLLPPGLTGLMAAALLAALMSTVSGALNSIATLFSYDLYKRWRPDASDRTLVVVGRIVTFAAMILAILWSPFISRWQSIYQGCVAVICYLAPPITTVFIWGVLWRRASSKAAITTLIAGSLLGFAVFFLDFFSDRQWLSRYIKWEVPSMMATFYLFVVCSVIMIVVSYRFPHKHTAQSEKLVWTSPLEALRGPAWRGIGNYKILAALLFAIMVLVYFIFATEATQRWVGLLR
jgi:SSS family solute:Na+ symporter